MMQALLAPLRELAELEEIQKEQKKEAGMLLLSNCSGSEKTHLMYGLSGEFSEEADYQIQFGKGGIHL